MRTAARQAPAKRRAGSDLATSNPSSINNGVHMTTRICIVHTLSRAHTHTSARALTHCESPQSPPPPPPRSEQAGAGPGSRPFDALRGGAPKKINRKFSLASHVRIFSVSWGSVRSAAAPHRGSMIPQELGSRRPPAKRPAGLGPSRRDATGEEEEGVGGQRGLGV